MGYRKIVEAQWVGKVNVTDEDAKSTTTATTKEFETPEQVRAVTSS